eukprot:scaffold254057_cov30-Prasinocladus_malaysianus.AAC.1
MRIILQYILGRSRAPRRRRRATGGEGKGGGELLMDRELRTAEWRVGHDTAGIGRCMSKAARGWPHPILCVGCFGCFGPNSSGADLPAFERVQWQRSENSGTLLRGVCIVILLSELTGQDISGMEGHAEGYHPQAWRPYPRRLASHSNESEQKNPTNIPFSHDTIE